MPPKRSTRASTRGPDPVVADQRSRASVPRTSSTARLRNAAVTAAMEASPAKYSTSYGSPPTAAPERQVVGAHGTDLAGAFGSVLSAVQEDNRRDARQRAEREAQEASRKNEADRLRRIAEERESQEDDDDDIVELIETVEEREQITPRPQRTNLPRSSSVQPPSSAIQPRSTALHLSSSVRRLFSEPPSHHKFTPNPPMSTRSFIEESNVFGNAKVFTPGPSPNVEALSRRADLVAGRNQLRPTNLSKDSGSSLPNQAGSSRQTIDRSEKSRQSQPVEQLQPTPNRNREEQEEASSPQESISSRLRNSARKASRRLFANANLSDEDELQSSPPQFRNPGPSKRSNPRDLSPVGESDLSEGEDAMPPISRNQRGGGKERGGVRLKRPARKIVGAEAASGSFSKRSARSKPARAVEDDDQNQATPKRRDGRRKPSTQIIEREEEEDPLQRQSQLRSRVNEAHQHQAANSRIPDDPTFIQGAGKSMRKLGDMWNKMATAITFLVLSWIAIRVIVISTMTPEQYGSYRLDNRLHWYGSDWRKNIQQFVPYSLLHPLGAISDEEFNNLQSAFGSHDNQIAKLKDRASGHDTAVENLRKIIPSVVRLEKDSKGNKIIPQDFWYALRDLISADKEFFTLKRAKDGKYDISDLQWATLKGRLERSGFRTQDNDALSAGEVGKIAQDAMAKSWESYIRSNSNRVKEILGVDAIKPGDTDQEAADKLMRFLKSKSGSQELSDVLVTKDEFLRQLREEMIPHRHEIKAELAELNEKLQEVVRNATKAHTDTTTPSPSGFSEKEIVALVERTVRKVLGDTHLEAVAQGKIRANYAEELSHQVNFFSFASGAVVNERYSSPTFVTKQPRMGTDEYRERRPGPGLPYKRAALEGWQEDGDCWCAGIREGPERTGPADLVVDLGVPVVPTHFVVEHIDPAATLDPGSAPRDVEVWAEVQEVRLRRVLEDWSLAQFGAEGLASRGYHEGGSSGSSSGGSGGGASRLNRLAARGYVKIGEFAYENVVSRGGLQVYRFSQELASLGASTESVLVRAVTNAGSDDHTCFYRLRLYGERRDEDVVPHGGETVVGGGGGGGSRAEKEKGSSWFGWS
ncbi:uncharacterized protein E0L32_006153 [Thyridium curvatum]|uniref:SUN domain-containing protein n=1 Tax=Thyridium curvatum TaxID=1093900 RepID=A0A507B0J9_9PEZI|nr:uncharacterized protein E0L32_006153 [Thyridium curvatum]TPX13423.1 hypothetical protein E0L32_006153 [Thyridium curvatum]